MLKKIGGCFGSIRVAVVLLALLAVVCGWATFIERDFGTPAVQTLVYRALWFHALIALLGLNVLAAALVRLPWKKGHLPFLLAHGGILILIVGCYLTFSRGVEGKMTIAEGTSSSTAVRSNDWAIRIERLGGADEKTDKAQTAGEKSVEIPFSGGPISRALLSRDGWKKYIVEPREARRDEPRTFFGRLSRSIARVHLSAVRRLAKWTMPNPRTIPTGVEGLTLELLDYLVAGEVEEKEEGDFSIHPAPFNKETANEFYAQLHLRALLDGKESVFWIRTLPTGVSEAEARFLSRTVASEKRAVRIALVNQTFDPGFSLHVQKFEPLFEPGSSTPASFSSVVDYHLTGGAAKESADAAPQTKTIGMNRPGKFFSPTKGRVWTYQDSYRGPYFPGQPIFEQTVKGELLPGETVPREKIYETVLSLNADPGRPWKYFGSFLIVLGTYLLIRHRKKVERKTDSVPLLTVLILCACAAAPLSAEESAKTEPTKAEKAKSERTKTESPAPSPAAEKTAFRPDWSAWRLLPVASGGRIMPLDTFARQTVRELCGSIRPEIAPDVRLIEALEKGTLSNLPPFDEMLAGHEISDAEREAMKKEYDRLAADSTAEQKKIAERLRKIFPENKARRFEPEELIFAWIVEPEVWRYIPFLRDPDDLIGRLTGSKQGGKFVRLEKGRFLSPSEVERCADFSSRIDRLQKREASLYPDRETAKREGNIDRAAATVERNLSAFRAVAFFPGREPPPMSSYYLDQILYPPENGPMGESAPPILEQLDRSCATLKTLLRDEKNQKIDSPFEDDSFLLTKTIRAGRSGNERVILDLIRRILLLSPLAEKGNYAESARQFGELLNECFAAQNRLTAHRNAAISGKLGTEPYRRELLRCAYLMEEVVRRIESATLALSTTGSYRVSTLADKKRLRAREGGASTEYEGAPAASLSILETGSLDLLPNGALPLLKTGDESARSPWISIQSMLLMPDGLAKRFLGAADSDSLPKDSSAKTTGSFLDMLTQKVQSDRDRKSDGARAKAAEAFLSAAEIYVGKKSGSSDDWRRALSEFSGALADLGAESNQTRLESAGLAPNDSSPAIAKTFYPNADAVQKLRAETLYNRLDAFYWLWFFSLLGVGAMTLGELGERFSSRKTAENGPKLLGKIGFISTTLFLSLAALLTAAGGALRAFITGWAPVTNMFETVVLLAFFVLILTLGYTYWPILKRRTPKNEKTRSIYARRGMIFLGGLLALGIGLAAYYNRAEFNPNIRPPVAVLRSNFWLTIHVLAIIASYACGSVAWFLSLTMLGGYLFGRRPTAPSPSPGESRGSSAAAFEPVLCAKIAPIVLQMLRWATLLLTVGTILGALWADFSWGRFWSWDPKEVWALVTLLIYLVVLHARLFMRRSNFGLAVGGVVGAMAIIMTWYGLSFVFGGGGRHAYTGGESNKELILYSLLAANILLAVAAAYWRFYFRK